MGLDISPGFAMASRQVTGAVIKQAALAAVINKGFGPQSPGACLKRMNLLSCRLFLRRPDFQDKGYDGYACGHKHKPGRPVVSI